MKIFNKKFKTFFLVGFFFLFFLSPFSNFSQATDYYRVNSSNSQTIFGKIITNNSSYDYFVPVKTTSEWNNFLNNLPSNVTQKNTPPASCSVSWSSSSITAPGSSAITWSSNNAVSASYSCSGPITQSGNLNVNGSLSVSFGSINQNETEKCTITVENSTGQTSSCSASLNLVPHPTCSVSWNTGSITAPGSATASWNSQNAVAVKYSCTGPQNYSGNWIYSDLNGSIGFTFSNSESGTETCQLTFKNSLGAECSASDSLTVNACVPTYTSADCGSYCGTFSATELGGNCGQSVNCGGCGSYEACSNHQCISTCSPTNGYWTNCGWSSCSASCGYGTKTYSCSTYIRPTCGGSHASNPSYISSCYAGTCCSYYYKYLSGYLYASGSGTCMSAHGTYSFTQYSYPYKYYYQCFDGWRVYKYTYKWGCW